LVIRVHVQYTDRGTADGRFTNDVDAVPLKVIPPPMTPWVEQCGHLVCFGIYTRQIGAFTKITVDTRESEIVDMIGTAVLLGDDVLNV